MKNRFIRLISTILILSFLVSALSVFSYAEDTGYGSESNEIYSDLQVFYNRTYEDGWDHSNGFTMKSITSSSYNTSFGSNDVHIDREEDLLGNYNYFIRMAATNNNAVKASVDFKMDAVRSAEDNPPKTIVELSVKADDVAYLGQIAWMTMAGTGAASVSMLDINKAGEAVLFSGMKGGALNLGKLENKWLNIAYIFEWTADAMKVTVRYGYGLGAGYSEKAELSMPYPKDSIGMQCFFVGFPAAASRAVSGNDSIGMSYCLDNLRVYQNVDDVVKVDPDIYGYGGELDTNAEKVIEILESSTVKSKAQILNEALAMKLGVDNALIRNVKYPLVNNSESKYNGTYGAPQKKDGNVLVPIELIVDYIGFPSNLHEDNMSFDITTGTSTTYMRIGSESAVVDGVSVALSMAPGALENSSGKQYIVIALEDIPVLFPGWLAMYDDMGLIIVYEDTTPENLEDNAPIVDRSQDLDAMVDMMKRFVFDTVTADKAQDGYVANGKLVYEDTKANTNNFAHPYIMANADTFEKLSAKYALTEGKDGYDANLKAYIKSIIDEADAIYSEYASVSGKNYTGIKEDKVPKNANQDGDGYDSKGKMTDLVNWANLLPTLAFAYQITENANYAKLAYDLSAELASWSHWGPGYFTHCAEVTMAYSIAYDWLYNAYKALNLDTDVLAMAIYDLGVHDGYISSSGRGCEHARNLGDLSKYNTATGSTNAVGTAGMIVGALAILDFVDSEGAPESAYDETMYLIGNNIQSLVTYGLDIYAPDGSYIESATYWEYATSNFFRMVMALESATGTNYGLMNTWGIDRTCYYAIHIEDSEGIIWNYHDECIDIVSKFGEDELLALNTDMFNFVGSYYGDETLVSIRAKQLADGKRATIYDLLFYPFDGVKAAPELELDYHMEAIDAFVTRSDWNPGAIYAGLMGGMNNVDHGQIDSGNFIYRNGGIDWVVDLGGDNPYITGYSDASDRYKYYKLSGEGQNVIVQTSPPATNSKGEITESFETWGQDSRYGGVITKTFSNEHGSYAILDNKASYGGQVTYALRGMLLTNDRSTVVLQDEFTFKIVESLAWIIHTKAQIKIDDNGRVAYLTQLDGEGKQHIIRVSIVSIRDDFTFSTVPATSPMLDSTVKKVAGNELEDDRSEYSRLVIEKETVSFDVAVVFEAIDSIKDAPPVSYEWTEMSRWTPSAPQEITEDEETVEMRSKLSVTDIKDRVDKIKPIISKDTAYTDRLDALYTLLADVQYIVNVNGESDIKKQTAIANAYKKYGEYLEEYNEFIEYLNNVSSLADKLGLAVCGVVSEVEEEIEE